MKNYEKVEDVLSIIGAIVSVISTILYLSSNSVGIGKSVVLTILSLVVGASVVFSTMDNIRNTDEAVVVGILLVLFMPIISVVMTYCFLLYRKVRLATNSRIKIARRKAGMESR